ncbi:cytochrome c-type biogenesis CcmF C-terminal domain-containing protein [Methanolobus sp. ZRKC2]|uniref:cytochrome c-type biogenesis CcmF C-terminal domain-containing protein n=1 Tax=Methanolobus sp. ZRKC2 TaxID=3125783 RepID=UPI00324E3F0D
MKDKKPVLTSKNTMLATVIVFLLLATIIMMGMITPLIAKLTTGVEISLEPEYFNNRTALPTAALVLILSTCLLVGYMGQKNTLVVVGGYALLSIFFAIISPFGNLPIDVSVPIIAVALMATIYKIIKALGQKPLRKKVRGFSAHLIHLGILFILLGIVLSSNMKVEGTSVVSSNEVAHFPNQNYVLKITGMDSSYKGNAYQQYPGSSYVTQIDFEIYKRGEYFREGRMEYITDFKWGQSYTTTYIHRGLTEELFVAPRVVDLQEDKIDIYMRTVPFINFLWGGMYLMVIGIIALLITDRRKDAKESPGNKNKITKGGRK